MSKATRLAEDNKFIRKLEGMTREERLALLPEEKKVFLEKVRKGRRDPVYFVNEILGVPLHDGQRLWLWMTTKTQREGACELGIRLGKWKTAEEFGEIIRKNPDFLKNILVPSNRWGKTVVTSVKHIWYNFYKIGVRGEVSEVGEMLCGTLNLSPHSNQVDAGYRYVIEVLTGKFVFTVDGITQRNKCLIPDFFLREEKVKRVIYFKNRTTYKGVPTGEDKASSLAGSPYLYISYDECAQSMHLKEELPAKIMSRLIDFGGPLDLVSTPEVDRPSHQYYFHICKQGLKNEEGWWTLIGAISDNSFLNKLEADKVLGAIKETDPQKYLQVSEGAFVTTGKKMFDGLLIERIWSGIGGMENILPMVGHRYLVTVDWGFSDTGDPTVIYVIDYTDVPRYRIVYHEEIKGGAPFAVFAQVKMIQRYWNGAKLVHDATNLGGVMAKKMMKELEIVDIIDFVGQGGNKAEMLFCMLVVLSSGRVVELGEKGIPVDREPNFGRLRSPYLPKLEEQLGNYQYNPAQGVSDKKLEQDEVMSLGMGLWWLEKKIAKTVVKAVDFNPLAGEAKNIFNEKAQQVMQIKNLVIPERGI